MIKIFSIFKKEKHSRILNHNSLLDKRFEISLEELSHYPNHVLIRALNWACRLVILMDPEDKFKIKAKHLKNLDQDEVSDLSKRLVNLTFNTYLEEKESIDKTMIRRIH